MSSALMGWLNYTRPSNRSIRRFCYRPWQRPGSCNQFRHGLPGSYLTAGILTFLGNFRTDHSGVLALALGSSSSVGTYDELDVDGNVTLGGSLTLSLLPSST